MCISTYYIFNTLKPIVVHFTLPVVVIQSCYITIIILGMSWMVMTPSGSVKEFLHFLHATILLPKHLKKIL
jgi:hypothetical protein